MRRKGMWRLGAALLVLCLAGCWDAEYLRDASLGYGLGIDVLPDGQLMQTVELVVPGGGQTSPVNEVHSGLGHTTRQTSDSLRKTVTGNIRYVKYGFMVMGKAMAEQDVYPFLDISYRDPTNPTANVKLMVFDGQAAELIRLRNVGNELIGEFLKKKIASMEQMSVFPEETLETLLPKLMDPGQDFVLPYLQFQDKEVVVKGLAMFHENRMTGWLNDEEALLYTLLSGKKGHVTRLSRKVLPGSPGNQANYMTVDAGRKVKRKLKVHVLPGGQIRVDLHLKLFVTAIETPKEGQASADLKQAGEVMSKLLTEEVRTVLRKMQKARCDGFGVGRRLIALHPQVWKQADWGRDYETVEFQPQVTVKIVDSGVID